MQRNNIKITFLCIIFSFFFISTPRAFAVPGVNIVETDGSTYVVEGGETDQYSVVLTEAPTADVIISLNYNSSQISVSSNTIIFTPLNWNVFQIETVSALDDSIKEGTQVAVVSHSVTSSDPKYNGIFVDWIAVQIGDNESDSVSIHGRILSPVESPVQPPGQPSEEEEEEEGQEQQEGQEEEEQEGGKGPSVSQPEARYESRGEQPQKSLEGSSFIPLLNSLPLVGAPFVSAVVAGFPLGFIPGMAFLAQMSGFWEAFFRLPLALFFWKPKPRWSVIYSAATKVPLRWALFTVKTINGKVIGHTIADERGRFAFEPPDERFKGEAEVAGYVFPSSLIPGDYDDFYGRVYHGEVVDPKTNKRNINDFNCPLDPLRTDSPKLKLLKKVSFIGKLIFFIGLVWSIYATYVNPKWYNFVVLLFYFAVLLFATFLSYKRATSFGVVRSKENGQPLNNVWLHLIDARTGKVVDMRLTDKTGRYHLYALPGQFVLKAMHTLYKTVEIDIPYYSKERVIHEDIWLEKAQK